MRRDIKRAVLKKFSGHPQIDADLWSRSRSNFIGDLQREVAELRGYVEYLESALEEIQKGLGPFSRDPLIHADNTIKDMIGIAAAALNGTWEEDNE